MCSGEHDFIPALGTVRVRMVYSTPGGVAMNVFYMRTLIADLSPASIAALATTLEIGWHANIADYQSSSIRLDYIEVTSVEAEPGITHTNYTAAFGLADGEILPSNVTYAVSFRSGLTGRSFRGRLYHLGLVKGWVAEDELDGVRAAAIVEAYKAFLLTDFISTGWELVIVSYCADRAWRTIAEVTTVTEVLAVNTELDSQRRRLVGRGI